MPLKAVNPKGNMYPWVTHTHSHLGGECPHKCVYCYVDNPRFGRAPRYTGPVRLIEEEFNVQYDQKTLTKNDGKWPATIFVEHMNDIGSVDVVPLMRDRILAHCYSYPFNRYVFQSKNPRWFLEEECWMDGTILGTTIESNRYYPDLAAACTPRPIERVQSMERLKDKHPNVKTFVTIEPVLDFDVAILAQLIDRIRPDFLNLGADSKKRNLPEPTVAKVMSLVDTLHNLGIELREKHNLSRLKQT